MSKKWALLVLVAGLVLSACGGGGGSGFSGTVTAPSGASVQGTEVLACYYDAAADDCDPAKSKSVTINTAGRSSSFSIEGLSAGDHLIIAVNQSQNLVGFYLDNQGQPALVKPPRGGLTIQLTQAALGSSSFPRKLMVR
ncbi:MAG: hypothetical protein K6T70_05735 [Meiothermus ruber]|uniref:hypothetical protein n=1 Tax=Meiothermus ruber TaxID=277 RepID=UPI0023F8A021|nr:hypothetical protein [Meiothermus ruber]MCL6529604.1 hypothetical protein [Meiothermus ruber]